MKNKNNSENQYIPLNKDKFTKRFPTDAAPSGTLPQKEKFYYKAVVKQKTLDKLNVAAIHRYPNFQNKFTVALAGSTRIDLQTVSEEGFRSYSATEPKSYTRFKNFARCVSIRNDGSLICGGEDGGYLHIFHAETKAQLRRIKCHQGPVSACAFSNNQLTFVATGGEDKFLRIWDISDGQCRFEIPSAHEDKITCIKAEKFYDKAKSRIIFASSSLDCSVKVWEFDTTKPEKTAFQCLFTLDHADPVTCIDFYPSSMLLVSGGATNIKIWDIASNGMMLHCIQTHVKSVTNLCVTDDGEHIVTCGYDRVVKIHDSSQFKVVHSITCDDVVISVNYWTDSNQKSLLFIGQINGQWILREYIPPDMEKTLELKQKIKKKETKAEKMQRSFFKRTGTMNPESAELLVEGYEPRNNLAAIDRFIHEFRYKLALSKAVQMKDTTGLVVIDSFIDRGVISLAVRDQNEESILPLLNFIHREFGRSSLSTPLLLEFLYAIIEENDWLYSTHSLKVAQAVQKISAKIEEDARAHQLLQELYGIVETMQTIPLIK